MIVISDYKPAWAGEFARIQSALSSVLGAHALRIDHIGSTSVLGLGAKDVIDVQVTVSALTPEIKDRLLSAGYRQSDAATSDHVPLGDDPNPNRWAKWLFTQPSGERRANIHIRIKGNLNQRYAILFRDYLRAHPNSVKTVELIKRQIAKRHADDMEAYYDIKDPVYDLIWDAAQDWARYTDWRND